MPARIRLPRLTRDEVEALVRAHACLAGADRALRDGGWKGAPAVVELVGQADAVIALLFNKAEASLIRQGAAAAAETGSGAPLASNPGESAGYGQFGAPAKGEV